MSNSVPADAFDFLDSLPGRDNKRWDCDDIWSIVETVGSHEWVGADVHSFNVFAVQAIIEGVSVSSNRLRFRRKPLVRRVMGENGRRVLRLTDAGKLIHAAILVGNAS